MNKHLRNSIVHTTEKNSSGTATQTVWTGTEWNGCVHTTLQNSSTMVRTVLPVQCERSINPVESSVLVA